MKRCKINGKCWAGGCRKERRAHHLCVEHYQMVKVVLRWSDFYHLMYRNQSKLARAESRSREDELRELPVDLLLKEVGYK